MDKLTVLKEQLEEYFYRNFETKEEINLTNDSVIDLAYTTNDTDTLSIQVSLKVDTLELISVIRKLENNEVMETWKGIVGHDYCDMDSIGWWDFDDLVFPLSELEDKYN